MSPPRAARMFWAVLALLACILYGPIFVDALRPAPHEGIDFFQEWSSARNWRGGTPVYAPLDEAAERHLGRSRNPGELWLFNRNAHPPTAVLLALPFAWLSYTTGALVWNLLSLTALLASLWVIARELKLEVRPWHLVPAVTLCLVCNPLLEQTSQAQLNLFLLLLLVGGWAHYRQGHDYLAGVLLGAAAALKLFPGLLLITCAVRRRWQIVSAGSLSVLGVSALTALILGPAAYRDYFTEVIPRVADYRGMWPNASLLGAWTKWFETGAVQMDGAVIGPASYQPALASLGFILSGLIVLWLWSRGTIRASDDVAFGLGLTTMLLLSPVTWDHYLLLLVLPVVQMWRYYDEASWERIALAGILVSIFVSPLVFRDATINGPTVVALAGSSVLFFALAGLFALNVRLADGQTTSALSRDARFARSSQRPSAVSSASRARSTSAS